MPHESEQIQEYFTVDKADTALYVQIQNILTNPITENILNNSENYKLPEFEASKAKFYSIIVEDILKKNDTVMRAGIWLAPFFGLSYSSHSKFKMMNLQLIFALRAIAECAGYGRIQSLIKDGIDQLLFNHLLEMAKSELFYRNLSVIALDFGRSIQTNKVKLVSDAENKFTVAISRNCLAVIDAAAILTKEKCVSLQSENASLKKTITEHGDMIKELQTQMKILQDLVGQNTSPKVGAENNGASLSF